MVNAFGYYASSKGMVSVPNLSGLTRTNAITAIQNAGLVYVDGGSTNTGNQSLDDTVASQLPNAGELVDYGTNVSFIYYDFVPVTPFFPPDFGPFFPPSFTPFFPPSFPPTVINVVYGPCEFFEQCPGQGEQLVTTYYSDGTSDSNYECCNFGGVVPFFPPAFPTPFFPPEFGPWFPSFQFLSIGSGTLILTPTGYTEVSNLKVGDKLVSLNIEELTNNGLGDEILTWSSDTFTVLDTVETEITSIVETQRETDLYQINSDWFTPHHDILVRKDGIYRFATADSIDTTYEVYSYADKDWKPVENINVINGEMQTVYTINCEPYDIFFTHDALVYNLREF